MRSHTRAIFVSAAVALLTIFIALGRAVADPPAAGATAPAPATPDKDIYFTPKTLDLEFFLPGEYTQVSVDEASAHGDTFEAFGPAEKDAFKPHIEMIRFDNLPKNAVVNKDLIHQMATMMGQKVNDFKPLEQGDIVVAGKSTPYISSSFRFKPDKKIKNLDTNLLVRNKQVFFIHAAGGKDIGFMFVFTGDAARYDQQVKAFDHLINTISFPSVTDAAKSK